jgi:hypothetical protein
MIATRQRADIRILQGAAAPLRPREWIYAFGTISADGMSLDATSSSIGWMCHTSSSVAS